MAPFAFRTALVSSVVSSLTLAGLSLSQVDPRSPQDDPQAPQDADQLDPFAWGLIERVGHTVEQSRSFTTQLVHGFEIRGITDETEQTGPMDGVRQWTYELSYEQPNLMRFEGKEGTARETIVSDGEHLYIHLPQHNRYVRTEAPSDLRALLSEAHIGTGPMLGGPLAFIGPVLVPEPMREAGFFTSATHVGTEMLDGVMTHRVSLRMSIPDEAAAGAEQAPTTEDGLPSDPPTAQPPRQQDNGVTPPLMEIPDFTFDVWIEEGEEDRTILRRVHFDLTRLFREMEREALSPPEGALPPEMTFDMWVTLDDWDFEVEIPEERFAFTPPEGAQRVDSIFEAVVGRRAEQRAEHPMKGERAPGFELQRLVGTQMSLSDHLGSDIVILDFWATWCTPCVRAMPHMISVAEEFRDQNVVLYAVNLREDFDRVQQFVDEQKWDLKVPMDIDGRVAQLYQVRAIPQTVIIDRNGIIQAVHIGFAPGMEERLRSEIETLLDGGSLIDDAEDADDAEEPDEDENDEE